MAATYQSYQPIFCLTDSNTEAMDMKSVMNTDGKIMDDDIKEWFRKSNYRHHG